ncbi:MAG: amphi-Trp domain-containing protein [Desulfovibrio sp.]|uniref:amphi-Trp domain-containing protein n=1 Tax=Desulfovibrio sp. 7SRBS1 TaxID=3378064 RepID=UPI003B427844
MSKKKLKIEGLMDLSQAAEYVESVLTSIREGSLNVEKSGEQITLTPQSTVSFEMSLSQKKEKEKICIEISWKRDLKAEEARNIQIGSDASGAA